MTAIIKHTSKISTYVFGILLSSLLFTVNAALCAEVVDRIVAVVNDDIISLYELNQRFKPYYEKIKVQGYGPEKEQEMVFEVRQRLLDQLIDQKLTDQELKRMKIKVSDKEVDNALERFKESRFITDEQLRAGLAAEGISFDEYREGIRGQLLRAKLVNREVKSKIVITQEDVKKYYESHAGEYGGDKNYHLKNIFLKFSFQTSEEEKKELFNKLSDIRNELDKGKSFEELARLYSQAPSAAEGGDLGQYRLDELSPQLQEYLKGMKSGEYTPIMELDIGYQIIYVKTISVIGGKSFEQASAEIRDKIYAERVDKKYRTWLEELRGQAHIKVVN